MATSFSQTAAYIWSLADLLRGDFKQSQYGRVILPFTILRRLECVLEARKPRVLQAGFQRVVFDMLLSKQVAPASDAEPQAEPLPFRVLPPEDVLPFENCVPFYESLKIAAGRFSSEQRVAEVGQEEEIRQPDRFRWVALPEHVRPRRGLFVAQVVSHSMDRRIPPGAYCFFQLAPEGVLIRDVCRITHRNEEAYAGALAMVVAIRAVAGGAWKSCCISRRASVFSGRRRPARPGVPPGTELAGAGARVRSLVGLKLRQCPIREHRPI